MSTEPVSLEIECPEKLMFFGTEKWRLKGAKGGRGAAKSITVTDTLLLKSLEKRRLIVCGRYLKTTIDYSIHSRFVSRIHSLGIDHLFSITGKEITAKNTGSRLTFVGVSANVEDLKSLDECDIFWGEEAFKFSSKLLEVLIPTVRAEGSELWFTWNTELGDEPIEKLFQGRDDAKLVEINYPDNPWFPDVLKVEMEACKRNNYPLYEHIWMGKPGGSGRFLPEFSTNMEAMRVQPRRFNLNELNLYGSLDYGDGNAPDAGATSFGLWNIDKKTGKPTRLMTYYQRNMFADAYAREIVAMITSMWETGGLMPHAVFADPSIFIKKNQEGGRTTAIADYFRAFGLNMIAANNDRVNGWRVVRNAFSLDAEGQPGCFFWDGYNDEYEDLIPRLQTNEKKPEDAAKGGDAEHLCDDVRYGLVSFMSQVRIANPSRYHDPSQREEKVLGFNDILKPRMISLVGCY